MLRHDRQIRGRCVRKFSAGCKREDPSNSESLVELLSFLSSPKIFPFCTPALLPVIVHSLEYRWLVPRSPASVTHVVCIFNIFPRISHSRGIVLVISDLTGVTTWLRFLITLDCAPPTPSCPRGNHVRAFQYLG